MCTYQHFKDVACQTIEACKRGDHSQYLMEQHGHLTELYTQLQCDTATLRQACILLDLVAKRVYARILMPDQFRLTSEDKPHH